jgi:hypothetical protein
MKKVAVLLLLMMGLWCWSNSIPQVENFNVNQRLDGSQLIDVFYDVSDTDGDTLTVTMQASNDDGITWILNCEMITGDFGENIMSGTGKQIVWDFGEEHPGNFSENYKVRLQIDDHFPVTCYEILIDVENLWRPSCNRAVCIISTDHRILCLELHVLLAGRADSMIMVGPVQFSCPT